MGTITPPLSFIQFLDQTEAMREGYHITAPKPTRTYRDPLAKTSPNAWQLKQEREVKKVLYARDIFNWAHYFFASEIGQRVVSLMFSAARDGEVKILKTKSRGRHCFVYMSPKSALESGVEIRLSYFNATSHTEEKCTDYTQLLTLGYAFLKNLHDALSDRAWQCIKDDIRWRNFRRKTGK